MLICGICFLNWSGIKIRGVCCVVFLLSFCCNGCFFFLRSSSAMLSQKRMCSISFSFVPVSWSICLEMLSILSIAFLAVYLKLGGFKMFLEGDV